MHRLFFTLLFYFSVYTSTEAQSITEKELFTLAYEGDIDLYSFNYDEASGSFVYMYFIDEEKKYFLIYRDGVSEKYDYISVTDTKYDSKGNVYTVAGNYTSDYGIDNNFLILNGKTVLNYNYIESYSAFINRNGEYVFVFKEGEDYKIGKYSPESGLKQSGSYQFLRTVYSDSINYFKEGDEGSYKKDNYYRDGNGERCFIGIKNGKASIISESGEINTEYSDINDASLTVNKNNELSFIAKKGGRFYEKSGNEFVVSGKQTYRMFPTVYPPLKFTGSNEPVYYCSDSLAENKYRYYVVKGNDVQTLKKSSSKKKINFGNGISDLKISNEGIISYIAYDELIIPKKPSDSLGYDEYFSKAYYVVNGDPYELGYNLGNIKSGKNGEMLFTAIADIRKKEYLLIESNGVTSIIQNRTKFDQINEYGYSPSGLIYYTGFNNLSDTDYTKIETSVYIANELKGKFGNLAYQYSGNSSYILKFSQDNNYAFVTEENPGMPDKSEYVYVNSRKLPFPGTTEISNGRFYKISGLYYSPEGRLFYTGEYSGKDEKYYCEIYIDNVSAGKVYNSTGFPSYDTEGSQMIFFAVRDKTLYSVKVKF